MIDLSAALAQVSRQQIYSIAEANAPINLWEGSVRSGKTIASIVRWFRFIENAPTEGELVMIGRTRDTLYRNVIEPMTKTHIFGPVAASVQYTPGAPMASIMGRRVHMIGANDAQAEPKVRGLTVAGGYVDEVTVIGQKVFDQLVARCSVPGAMIFATTNPDNPGHWLRKEYMLRAADVGMRVWHFTIDDNPHLPPEYVARLKRTYQGLWYRRFILGHWVAAAGSIYDMWDPDKHVVKTLPRMARWLAASLDYGTTNPFDAVMIGIGIDGRMYVTNEYRYDHKRHPDQRRKTDAEYSKALRGWMAGIRRPGEGPDAKGVQPEYVVVDPSAASFKVQLYQDGLSPYPGDNSVIDGIRTTANLLGSGALVVHDSCTDLIDEIPGYCWDDEATERGEDKPIKAEDHSCDALRYGVHTTRGDWWDQIASRFALAA